MSELLSISISVPPELMVNEKLPKKVIYFASQFEKDKYIHDEAHYTRKALTEFNKAFTIEERNKGRIGLYHSRISFAQKYTHEKPEPEPELA